MKKVIVYGLLFSLVVSPAAYYVGKGEANSKDNTTLYTSDPSKIYTVDELIAFKNDLLGKTIALSGQVVCLDNDCSLYSKNGSHIPIYVDIMSNRSKLKMYSSNHEYITVMGYTSKHYVLYGDGFYGTELIN